MILQKTWKDLPALAQLFSVPCLSLPVPPTILIAASTAIIWLSFFFTFLNQEFYERYFL